MFVSGSSRAPTPTGGGDVTSITDCLCGAFVNGQSGTPVPTKFPFVSAGKIKKMRIVR